MIWEPTALHRDLYSGSHNDLNKWEGSQKNGIYVYTQTHSDGQQKLTQHGKATILQEKLIFKNVIYDFKKVLQIKDSIIYQTELGKLSVNSGWIIQFIKVKALS